MTNQGVKTKKIQSNRSTCIIKVKPAKCPYCGGLGARKYFNMSCDIELDDDIDYDIYDICADCNGTGILKERR